MNEPKERVVVEDEMDAECLATADGIVQCLQMLAEEAAGLRRHSSGFASSMSITGMSSWIG